MSKRDKKLNLKLNRLNEEDENTLEPTPEDEANKIHDETLEKNQEIISQEYENLKTKIHKVFKLLPYCEPNIFNLIDSNEKRLEYFNHSLLNRFCYTESEDRLLNVTNLDLNDETISHFTLPKLTSLLNLSEKDTYSSQELFNLNQNIKIINYLSLRSNNFKQLPYNLIDLFSNVNLIDLSENLIENLNLPYLNKFTCLKELNLGNNRLKVFGDLASVTMNEPIFTTLEKLNLSSNFLTSATSVLLSQFKNLKCLNLSDNNYLIDEQNQLPWQLMSNNNLGNLIELDMSKNNKLLDQIGSNQITSNKHQRTRSESVYSARSVASSANLSFISNKLIFKSFNCLTNLKILNLSENRLVNVPSDIKDLKFLEELILDVNEIEFIPNELTALKNLTTLSLRQNRLKELSDNFCQYAKFKETLQRLDLSFNNLKYDNLSLKICLFENLKYLNLSNNQFDLIPNTLPKNLENLDISNNRLKCLMIRPLGPRAQEDDDILIALDYNEHTSLNKLQKIKQKFDMNYDRPETDTSEELKLPHVFYLRNLKYLNASANKISEIPLDFGLLNSNLNYLNLSSNQINQISINLCRGLGHLKFLDLSKNKIRDITDKIRELTSLEFLNLSQNRLNQLNLEVCTDLKNLKELNLSRNYFESLPLFSSNSPLSRASSHQSNFPGKKFTFNLVKLEKIDLSFNKFKSNLNLYTHFSHCPSLLEINLSSNCIILVDTDELSSLLDTEYRDFLDDEKAKKLSVPKLKLSNLKRLNLSNNQVSFIRGGFIKFLNSVYKLAPNLREVIYEQSNGLKLGLIDSNESYCFQEETLDEEIKLKLEVLDLSSNSLKHFPNFLLDLKNLKELYFNGNFVQKIPSAFFKETFTLEEYNSNFKKLIIEKKPGSDEEIEDEDEETVRRRNKKKKLQPPKIDPLEEQEIQVKQKEEELKFKNYICDKLEILHLNSNRIESISPTFFSHFKCLKELKLNDNPLKDPPQQSICLSSLPKLARNKETKALTKLNESSYEKTVVIQPTRPKTSIYHYDQFYPNQKDLEQLPNLFMQSSLDLKPLQTYMIKYKNREDMMLTNMFMIIKDNIDSLETLLKLMRRLKMPMDRVQYVCKEINDSVAKNWSKIEQIEFKPEPGKFRLSRKELNKKMRQYILRLQAWNLLNVWRSTYGTDAQSEELVRIFKLMSSNQYEMEIYEKLNMFKLSSSMIRI
ncbi:unnamed protein product [Brachionus calyciflorus]|uniref:Uncharacterized protein n=1 Tax=Brachionus calyciflorus TaxID=104777 RepID=A0A813NEY4_9BILA|nr:unnamed protein product [Brachionus calyciflorus]